jgi:CBS domain-containing protein
MQLGLADKLRGIITEKDLKRWYAKCQLPQYRNTLDKSVIASIIQEMKLEFPLSESEVFDNFFQERNYDTDMLTADWQII